MKGNTGTPPTQDPMSTANKSAWRSRLRALRQETYDDVTNVRADHSPNDPAGRNLARTALAWLGSLPAGHAVCAFISMPGEPATGPLLASLMAAGYTVYVPVCEPNFHLSWTAWYPAVPVARSPLAPVMEPTGPRLDFEQLETVKAILVPALAVDHAGVRLGQGGGYYDRFLPRTAPVPVAAVVFAHEVLSSGELPHDEFDAPVHYALTPTEYWALGVVAGPLP